MKKEPQKGRIFNPDAKITVDTVPDLTHCIEVSSSEVLKENLRLRAEMQSVVREIKKFAEDKPLDSLGVHRVRLKSGLNLGELFTKYINDKRIEDTFQGRHVLTDLEQDIKKMLVEIADSIKEKL